MLNVAWHLSAAVVFQGCVPGLVPALSINLPFSIYIFRRAAREQWVSPRARLVLIPGALLLHGPVLVGLLLLLQQL